MAIAQSVLAAHHDNDEFTCHEFTSKQMALYFCINLYELRGYPMC